MKNQIKLLLALCSGLLLAGCSLSSSSSGSGVSPIARDYVLSGGVTAQFALCSGLLLAGCSLFGSSSGSGVSPVAHNLVIAGNTVQFAAPPALSSSKPKTSGGIVSQSSNVDGSNVTRDLFKASASGNPTSANYALLYDATGGGNFATLYAATMVAPDYFAPGSARRNYDPNFNGVTVDMNGDGSNDGRLWAGIDANHAVVSNTLNTDTDYYSKGWWLYAPSGSADYAMGAFIARPDADVFAVTGAMVTGMATYSASDTALYASKNSAEAGIINVGIQLTANFDSNKINGFMNFIGYRTPFVQSTMLSHADLQAYGSSGFSYNGTIALNETNIMSDSSFSGSGSGMLSEMYRASGSDHSFNQGTRNASVNWGGKFFTGSSSSSLPGKANGTFAGEIGDDSNGIRFVGSFSAENSRP
jgi:hypothetical protein